MSGFLGYLKLSSKSSKKGANKERELLDEKKINNYKVSEMEEEEILQLSKNMRDDWIESGFGENIRFGRYARDFVFKPGSQWDDFDHGSDNSSSSSGGKVDNRSVRSDRDGRGKSCFEMNTLRAVYREMFSEQKLNSPQAELVPTLNSKMPTDMMQTVQGKYRHDCYKSDTKSIYSVCYQNQLSIGYGAYYLAPVREDTMSFDTELRYFPISDATYAFFDPTSQKVGKHDGCGGGYWSVTSYRDLKSKHPKKEFAMDIGQSVNDVTVCRGQVAYCNLYVREPDSLDLIKLVGEDDILSGDEWSKRKKAIDKYNSHHEKAMKFDTDRARSAGLDDENFPVFERLEYPEIERQESVPTSKIYHIVHTRSRELSRELLPVKEFLPIFYVTGDSIWSGGKEQTMPLCQEAIQIQKNINYSYSEIIDQINKSFGNIIVAHVEAVGNNTNTWNRPTVGNLATYETIQSSPNMDPRPSVLSSNAVDMGLLQFLQQQLVALYNVLGRSLENHGAQTNATSGKAILQRKTSGELAVGVYPENLNDAISVGAKCWVEWSPSVYDTEREITIIDKEGQSKNVRINEKDGDTLDEEGGLERSNNFAFRLAEFNIECQGGASFAGQMNAAMNALLEIMKVNVEMLPPVMIDLVIDLLPFPFKNQLKRRLKVSGFMNADVVAMEDGKPAPPPQPSPLQQMEQDKLQGQKLNMISDMKANQSKEAQDAMELLGKALDLKSGISQNLADEAKAFSEYPSEEIAQAISLSEQMLSGVSESVEETTENYLNPEEESIVQKVLNKY